MVNTCYVPFCQSGYKKRRKPEVPIYSFPKKKPALITKWMRFMNRIDNNLPKHSGICAKHFKEEFLKIGDRMTLRWDLDPVPTIYNSEFIVSRAFCFANSYYFEKAAIKSCNSAGSN